MIDVSKASIDIVSAHQIGNKNNGEQIQVSEHPLDIEGEELEALLKKYFLQAFQTPEFFRFTFSNGDFTLNPLYKFAGDIFQGIGNFHTNTVHVAKHLYESSNHPMIKSGDLFIANISNIHIGLEKVEALGIFKCENKQRFLQLQNDKSVFEILTSEGIQADKPDKACLIFNTEADEGYKICIFDKTNRGEEAAFWKEQFLMLKPAKEDEFHQTRDFLNMAKTFVTEQFTEEFEVNKSEQIDLLNRSMSYFKTRDNFNKDEFEQEVFQDEAVIESFQKFNQRYTSENDLQIEDKFDISLSAVKKQAKVFKSILKLDRNFHIYIHGNKDLIEQGVDRDGRKFYKIYYEKES